VIDLVVGTPVFLDLTLVGLESLPALGEERFAAALARSPGGGAITAVGAARLGLSTALAAPLGRDTSGDLVRAALAEEEVELIASQPAPQTPTTIVLPFGSSRAMVTVDPGVRASAADVAARAPRAVATNLDMLHLVPPGAMAYVTCGDEEARAFRGRPPAALAGSRALFVNRAEALALTGKPTAEEAAGALDGLAETVVVSLGADGALMTVAGDVVTTPAERVEKPVDTTGAGDLLTAAYIWADLRGAEPVDRLRWAVLYASLSVTTPTGIGGALDRDALVRAGTARGLTVPPLVGAVS
jgi:sugar/nucleoside kinase (ribokinase family)